MVGRLRAPYNVSGGASSEPQDRGHADREAEERSYSRDVGRKETIASWAACCAKGYGPGRSCSERKRGMGRQGEKAHLRRHIRQKNILSYFLLSEITKRKRKAQDNLQVLK